MKPEMECRLDPQVLADVVAASADFANELVDLFVQDSWSRVGMLSQALQSHDGTALRTVAHSLKGSAATVGARRLATYCHLLEQHAAASGDHGTATTLVTEIKTELSALVTMFAESKLGTIGRERGAA